MSKVVFVEESCFAALVASCLETPHKETGGFLIGKEEKQLSFDEFREKVRKLYFPKGAKLNFFIVNQGTGEKQNFNINPKIWPEGIVGGKNILMRQPYEITSCLQKIDILD